MTGRPTDPLDDELRETLRRRDPGAVPFELRARVLDVPEQTEPIERDGARRPAAALLGLAAVILLAVIGFATIRNFGQVGVTGSTGTPASSPIAATSPAEAFDPTLEGPGVRATDDFSPAILVVPACVLLLALTLTTGGWRRIFPAAATLLLGAWAVVGMFVPVTLDAFAVGPGLNIVHAPAVPGSDEQLFYELAPKGGRFSMGLGLLSEGPLPIRFEGIVSPDFGRDPRTFVPSMMLTAVWLDREVHGGMTGPIRPFAPFDAQDAQTIWLVGRAGACALGSAFDPSSPDTVGGFQSVDSLDVRVSIFGWPRTIRFQLPFRLVEPEPASCPGNSPEASSSP
jgi:hypothetical protein